MKLQFNGNVWGCEKPADGGGGGGVGGSGQRGRGFLALDTLWSRRWRGKIGWD